MSFNKITTVKWETLCMKLKSNCGAAISQRAEDRGDNGEDVVFFTFRELGFAAVC